LALTSADHYLIGGSLLALYFCDVYDCYLIILIKALQTTDITK